MGRRVGEGDRVSGTALGAFTGSIMVPISASERFSNLPTSHCLSVAEPGLTARPSAPESELFSTTVWLLLESVAKETVSLPRLLLV